MNEVFIYFAAELKEGSRTQGNIVLNVPQPIVNMADIVVLQDFIAKTLQYKVVTIIHWQRMETPNAA